MKFYYVAYEQVCRLRGVHVVAAWDEVHHLRKAANCYQNRIRLRFVFIILGRCERSVSVDFYGRPRPRWSLELSHKTWF